MAEHNETGKKGEDLANDYLLEKGYTVLERNWRFGQEEIDIIALKKNMLVVVEVKTRFSSTFGEPETFVTKQKQKHLIKAANAYIERKNLDYEVRFDIISIITGNNQHKINHLEDAFSPFW